MALLDRHHDPSPLELRLFGLLFALFFGLIGALFTWRFDLPTAGAVLWWVGGIGAVVYYGVPPARRFLIRLWMGITYPLGWLISHLILSLVYYVVLTPIGLVLRLFGRDVMQRKLDRNATSYWTERTEASPPSRYFKQF